MKEGIILGQPTGKQAEIMTDIVTAHKLSGRLIHTAQTKQFDKVQQNALQSMEAYLSAVNDQLLKCVQIVDQLKDVEPKKVF